MAKRPRLVFTAIVKNESAVIRRCLESVKPHISAWVISDTGSTDGTQALIREILKDIPGELIERPWVDFATNRNEAIALAAEKYSPDYCITLDADEQLTTSPGFTLSGLTLDSYDANFEIAGTKQRWARKLIFRPHMRYRFVLDETLTGGATQGMLPACLVNSYTDGARNADGMKAKFARDVEVLRKAVAAEPNEPRYWFYFAQRLAGCERYEEAIAAYEKRLAIASGFESERSFAQLMIGQCLQALNRPFEQVQAAYLKAWQMNPSRAEPLYALGCVHSLRGEHPLAELYARAAQRIPRPPDALQVDESVYAYRAVELLVGALAEQGKVSEALDLLEKLRALPQLPPEEHGRVDENLALLRRESGGAEKPAEKLGPDEQVYVGQAKTLRETGAKAFRHMGLQFLTSFQAQSLPSPLRWLWILCVALFGRWASIAGAVAAAPLAAWATSPLIGTEPALILAAGSPLLFLAGRRRLQDAPVAALTLAAIGFAIRGNPIGLGVALFALVGLKEAAALTVPALALAWSFSGSPWPAFAGSVGAAGAASLIVLLALFGSMLPAMLRAGAKGHATPYTLEHQRGAWHRLLVDLVLVSPVTTVAAFYGPRELLGLAAALVGAHLLAPIRNVRLVLAADLLLRMAAVFAFGWWIVPALAVDLYIARKLRAVYDPVTAALTSQLGMSR